LQWVAGADRSRTRSRKRFDLLDRSDARATVYQLQHGWRLVLRVIADHHRGLEDGQRSALDRAARRRPRPDLSRRTTASEHLSAGVRPRRASTRRRRLVAPAANATALPEMN